MKRFLKTAKLGFFATFALAAAVCFGPTPSKADVVWTLTDVPLDDGTLLSGQFTINVYGLLGKLGPDVSEGKALPGASYLPVINSVDVTSKTTGFLPPGSPYDGILFLTFQDPLTIAEAHNTIKGGHWDRLTSALVIHAIRASVRKV